MKKDNKKEARLINYPIYIKLNHDRFKAAEQQTWSLLETLIIAAMIVTSKLLLDILKEKENEGAIKMKKKTKLLKSTLITTWNIGINFLASALWA